MTDAEFHPRGHQVLIAAASRYPDRPRVGQAAIWNIEPISGPADDLAALARLLSSHQIDPNGTLISSEPPSFVLPRVDSANPAGIARMSEGNPIGSNSPMLGIWQALRLRYPDKFKVDADHVRHWHELVAWESESAGDWHAADFHLDLLLKARPHEEDFLRRRQAARTRLRRE